MFDININLSLFDKIETGEAGKMFVEKCFTGLGWAFAPFLAKQRAKARKIDTASELSDLQERTELLLICQEIRKQKNIESIIKQAVEELPSDISTENIQKMDEDLIAYIFKHCDIISDKKMQLIWARILAGEATKTGTFSKRTIDLVSKLDIEDANSFTSFCQFVWHDIQPDPNTLTEQNTMATVRRPTPLIYDFSSTIYTDKGINLNVLEHLNTLGLIALHHTEYTKGIPTNPTQDEIQANSLMCYFDEIVLVLQKNKGSNPPMSLGKCLLTKSGEELSRICGAQKNDDFFNYVITEWKKYLNPVIRTIVPK